MITGYFRCCTLLFAKGSRKSINILCRKCIWYMSNFTESFIYTTRIIYRPQLWSFLNPQHIRELDLKQYYILNWSYFARNSLILFAYYKHSMNDHLLISLKNYIVSGDGKLYIQLSCKITFSPRFLARIASSNKHEIEILFLNVLAILLLKDIVLDTNPYFLNFLHQGAYLIVIKAENVLSLFSLFLWFKNNI